MWKRLWKEEEGQSLVMFALLLSVLMGFTALVVDVGYFYAEKRQLQTAVDAAALAGAQDLPYKSTAEAKALEYANSNIAAATTDVNTPYKSNSKLLEVITTKEVPTIFGKVLGINSVTVTADSVAQKVDRWVGEALPFINLDDNYLLNSNMVVWENIGNGDYESLWKDEFDTVKIYIDGTTDTNNPSNNLKNVNIVYHDVKYEDGVQVTKGTVANVKDELKIMVGPDQVAYVFSLRSDVITAGTYKNADGTGKIKNKDVIPMDQLILLQVKITDYDYNSKTIKMEYVKAFDILKGEYPTEFLNNNERGTSKLVE